MKRNYKVLSVDAWADCCGCDHGEDSLEACWTWNNWFDAGFFNENDYGNLNKETALAYFEGEFINPEHLDDFEVEDDQYNYVLIEKKTRKPVLAIEYGSVQS